MELQDVSVGHIFEDISWMPFPMTFKVQKLQFQAKALDTAIRFLKLKKLLKNFQGKSVNQSV